MWPIVGEKFFLQQIPLKNMWDGKFEGKEVVQGTYYYNIIIVGQDKKTFVKQGTVEVIY